MLSGWSEFAKLLYSRIDIETQIMSHCVQWLWGLESSMSPVMLAFHHPWRSPKHLASRPTNKLFLESTLSWSKLSHYLDFSIIISQWSFPSLYSFQTFSQEIRTNKHKHRSRMGSLLTVEATVSGTPSSPPSLSSTESLWEQSLGTRNPFKSHSPEVGNIAKHSTFFSTSRPKHPVLWYLTPFSTSWSQNFTFRLMGLGRCHFLFTTLALKTYFLSKFTKA